MGSPHDLNGMTSIGRYTPASLSLRSHAYKRWTRREDSEETSFEPSTDPPSRSTPRSDTKKMCGLRATLNCDMGEVSLFASFSHAYVV